MHASAQPLKLEKPRLRGVSHQLFFFVAVAGGLLLTALAPGRRAMVGAIIYSVSLATLLGVSALYHRINWPPRKRIWMRRLDHSAIFVLIAGTYTPLCMRLPQQSGLALAIVWSCAAAGAFKSLLWPFAPKWVVATLCVVMGLGGILLVPSLVQMIGRSGEILLLAGGAFYITGAAFYALKRPNPIPGTFGYHEVFHALVIVAAICHYFMVAKLVAGL